VTTYPQRPSQRASGFLSQETSGYREVNYEPEVVARQDAEGSSKIRWHAASSRVGPSCSPQRMKA
jgi:hypothetical protein